jgi:membrane protein implicated in regulation of membrane protease activity
MEMRVPLSPSRVRDVSLELWYWIALGMGVGFLLLSIVFGDIFDFLDFLDFDVGDGIAATPIVFTALAAFGAGGLLGIGAFGFGAGASVLVGVASAVLFGGLAALLFAALRRQEAPQAFGKDQLIDARGRCTLTILPGKTGQVSVRHEGMTRAFTATSDEEIKVGDDVVVVDVVGNSLHVARAARA